MEKIIVTGCSGFIGMHLCKDLLKDGFSVLGIDNMNDYYSVLLKEKRLSIIKNYKNFDFINLDISNKDKVNSVFRKFKPNKVVNLAAQAGVRYSLENPYAYIESNIVGFINILEACRHNNIEGLIYASSSSVYGANKKTPFDINDRVDNPISIYAASKKSNELMAHSYSHLYGLNTTGLRFFTVYGPWGRPDMAIYIFCDKISKGEKIPVYNQGKMKRDFTYIDDVISGLRESIIKNYRCEIFNLGNNRCENLFHMISLIESQLNIKAYLDLQEMQPGDVKETFADISHSEKLLNYKPKTSIGEGIPHFVDWFQKYKKI